MAQWLPISLTFSISIKFTLMKQINGISLNLYESNKQGWNKCMFQFFMDTSATLSSSVNSRNFLYKITALQHSKILFSIYQVVRKLGSEQRVSHDTVLMEQIGLRVLLKDWTVAFIWNYHCSQQMNWLHFGLDPKKYKSMSPQGQMSENVFLQ